METKVSLSTSDQNTEIQAKSQASTKYPELNNLELEVISGGGNIFRRSALPIKG
jgi:uridylate kinase